VDRLKGALSVAILAGQLGAIVYARFSPARYFCWAPYDQHTIYELRAEVGGRALTPEEVGKRYRRNWVGFDPRSPAHLWDIVEQVELRQAPERRARVTMRYSVNGRSQPDWRWPARVGER